jgi:hypothetical protein
VKHANIARLVLVRIVLGGLLGAVILGCGEAENDEPEYVPLPPVDHGSPACGPGEVALRGTCLDCDAARAQVTALLRAEITTLRWDRCRSNSDCVSQVWDTPCDGQCNVAIASAAVSAFESAMPNFEASVCDAAAWEPICGAPLGVDCASMTHCIDGTCQICSAACVR